MEAEKKKILIRIGSLRHGGAEKVLVTFLKNLPKDKYDIDLLLNLYSGKYLSEVPDWINIKYLNKGEMITTNRLQDLPVKIFRVIYQKILKTFPGLLYRFILNEEKYDVEFAAIHGMRDEILNSPLKLSKKIVCIHNDLTKTEFKNYTAAEFRRFFGFDKVLVISEKIRRDFEQISRNSEERKKIVRIYNPLDTEEILAKSKLPVENYQFENKVKTFVSVGTIFPQKGFDRLLKVHRKLLNEGFKHRILIIGDGYDFENIEKLRQDLKITETVTLLGYTENPYPLIKAADYFVLSSRYEGFPTVLFEAITLKKKIIATDVSGVREMLQDGKLGLIMENSEKGIYEGIKKALEKPEVFAEYEQNLAEYQAPFNLKNSVQALTKIIDEL
ncbi:Glycosyltransferase involved in cell wall bisynthesis [Kaistella treverensis]|uniref:Glycosyltransferase involved in cell wall bisynthesis n=1 Tax=Kaistella treverensis TaxID=631455 RepID=A0A1I3M964_9FLAO|nr:glycosyltransferase [Kaistella treverensis]SFI93594.1 Glycosyltransferase involved in cell wall bisynthesis [Kaistella treverensis]